MELEQLISIERIRRIMAAYCHRIDDGDLDGWAALFASDATLAIGRHEHVGRDAIRAWAESAAVAAPEPTRHVVVNPEIDVTGAEATAVSDFLVLSASMSVLMAGRYADRLARGEDGEWTFVERRISFLRPAAP